MQAVLLVGGFGTRLRPLTYSRPKVLLPLMNRPMISYILESLPVEVQEVIVPVSYMAEKMRAFFSSLRENRNYTVIHEERPLGTGGALKNVENLIRGDFLVFNGDIITSLDVSKFIEFHRRKGAFATINLWEVENPQAFGIVEINKEDRILRFKEKPKKGEIFSNLVNAGIYILNEEILNYIPPREKVSLEYEIFPKVLDRGLYGYGYEGYWADAGTPETFLRANGILLEYYGTTIAGECRFEGVKERHPIAAEAGCTIVGGVIGPRVSLGKNVKAKYAQISDSVIFEEVEIEEGSVIHNSLIGQGCRIGKDCLVEDAIVADSFHIEKESRIIGQKVGMK